jgi:hypothetical protein
VSTPQLEDLPKRVRDIAWRAHVRLCRRFRRLVAAIARELAAFMWAIAREVPITA